MAPAAAVLETRGTASRAVLAVPAYFDDEQRAATFTAAAMLAAATAASTAAAMLRLPRIRRG